MNIEDIVAKNLAALLNRATDEICSDSRFVDIGVDSVLTVSLASRLEAALGIKVPPTLLWRYPSVTLLSERLARGADSIAEEDEGGSSEEGEREEPIAIVGMGCRFPGAPGLDEYWQLLVEGHDAIGTYPEDRPNAELWARGGKSCRYGGFLENIDRFEPGFFGISPVEAEHIDPQQRLALEVSWAALEDAGIDPQGLRGERVGVFLGSMLNDYDLLRAEIGREVFTHHSVNGCHSAAISGRVSYLLGFVGPSLTVNTACASSITAMHSAVAALRSGEAELALAGGVNVLLIPENTELMNMIGAVSPTSRCRFLDADADGMVRSEGAGVLVLKRLSDAIAAGDRVWAVVRATGTNHNGRGNGITAPNPAAQADLMREVWRRGGVSPREAYYVEAHGTATPLGDPIEAEALGEVMGRGRGEGEPLRIGSVKSNFGHTEAAAGAAGLIKVALMLHHGELAPSLHFRRPNPQVPMDAWRLQVVTAREPLPHTARYAGVSAFGLSGANAHVLLERWLRPPPRVATFSGGARELLEAEALSLARAPSDVLVPTAAEADWRGAVVGDDLGQVRERLASLTEPSSGSEGVFVGRGSEQRPAVAFFVAGIGGEWSGMAHSLLVREPVFRAHIERCDAAARRYAGIRVLDALAARERPSGADVNGVCQVAFGIALGALWRSWGISPDAVVGHSIGEIAAACIAGAIQHEEAIRIMCLQAEFGMRTAGHSGLVYVATLVERAEALMDPGSSLSIAVDEGEAVVVGGRLTELEDLCSRLVAEGIDHRRVETDIAPHTSLLRPFEDELRQAIGSVTNAETTLPLFSSVTGDRISGAELDARHWARNLTHRVELAGALRQISAAGITDVIQLSPHPIHTRSISSCLSNGAGGRPRVWASLRRGDAHSAHFHSAAGLHAAGVDIDWAAATGRRERKGAAVLVMSARTPGSLRSLAEAWRARLDKKADAEPLADLCLSAAIDRAQFVEHRLALSGPDRRALTQSLDSWLGGDLPVGASEGTARRASRLVFLFSGQGALWSGVGRKLLREEPVFRRSFMECDELLREYAGVSLLEAFHDDDAPRGDDTETTQRLLFATQVSLAAQWSAWGIEPDAIVGQSVGEVAAAHVAGALSLEDAVRLIVHRGRCLQKTVGTGGLMLVGLIGPLLEEFLARHPGLTLSARNAVSSSLVAGDVAALTAAHSELEERGELARMLNTAFPAHSHLVEPILEEFVASVGAISPRSARVPLFSTVTATRVDGSELDIDYWRGNIRQPVLLAPTLDTVIGAGFGDFLEISPHPVVKVAVRQQLAALGKDGLVTHSLRRGQDDGEQLMATIAELFVAGHAPKWRAIDPDAGRVHDLPRYPWERERYWLPATKGREQVSTRVSDSLLGERLSMCDDVDTVIWQAELSSARPAWLRDHRVRGDVVVPGAAWVEMALAALSSQEAFAASDLEVASLDMVTALTVHELSRPVQISVRARGAGRWHFRVASRARKTERWELHCEGELHRVQADPGVGREQDQDFRGDGEVIQGAALYADLAASGLEYGPGFQSILRLQRGKTSGGLESARAELELAPSLAGSELVGLHPALLDGCFQVLAAALPKGETTWLPTHLSGLRVLRSGVGKLSVCATLTEFDGLEACGSLVAWDEGGAPVLVVRRFIARALSPTALAPVRDWSYAERWLPAPVERSRSDGRFVLVTEDNGFARAVAKALEARGATVELAASESRSMAAATRIVVFSDFAADVAPQGEALGGRGDRPTRSRLPSPALLAPPRPAVEDQGLLREGTRDGHHGHLESGLVELMRLVELTRSPGEHQRVIVTRGARSVAGSEVCPAAALAWGFGRTLACERPASFAGLVDLPPRGSAGDPDEDESTAQALAEALLADDAEDQIALRGGRRYVARLGRVELDDASGVRLRADASYLITGGLGGLGLATARVLVERGAQRLLLMSRSGLPPRRQWAELSADTDIGRRVAAVRELERLGATVRSAAVDVADAEAVARVVDAYEDEHPGICGVIHAAGVLRDQTIDNIDIDAAREVLRPKLLGASALDQRFQRPLDFFVLFSSVAGVIGSPGQAVYSGANAFLDSLAAKRRAQGLSAQSLAWGVWADIGLAAALGVRGDRLAGLGMHGIPPRRGLELLLRTLDSAYPALMLAPVSWQRYRERVAGARAPFFDELAGAQSAAEADADVEQIRICIAQSAPGQRVELLADWLAAKIEKTLRLGAGQLEHDVGMNSVGIDSLFATELRNHIESELGLGLPVTALLGDATVSGTAERLAALMSTASADTAPETGAPPEPSVDELAPAGPLSEGQRALYFLHRLAPESTSYHVVNAFRLHFDVDHQRFEQALHMVIERHPLLNMYCPSERPEYRLMGTLPALGEVDARGRTKAKVQELLDGLLWQPFDLERERVFRAWLLWTDDGPIFASAIHHIAVDFWSGALVLAELAELYAALVEGRPPALQPLAANYGDFIRWQGDMLASPRGRELESYWRERLAGELPIVELPMDHPRPKVQQFRGRTLPFELTPALGRGLAKLARAQGVTLFTVLMSALQTLISRYVGLDDVLVGAPMAGRGRPQFEGVAGYFVNPVVIRGRFSPDMGFDELVRQLDGRIAEALDNQDYPFARLVDDLGVERDASRPPLMQVIFGFDQSKSIEELGVLAVGAAGDRFELAGLPMEALEIPQQALQADLTLMMTRVGERLLGAWQYDGDLFEQATIARFNEHFATLLRRVSAEPTTSVSRLPLLSPAELEAQGGWNATAWESNAPGNLYTPFATQAAARPNAPAVIAADRELSYGELLQEVEALAAQLFAADVRPETLVAVVCDKGWAQVVAVLAILRAGAAYLALSPSLPAARLARLLDHGQVRVVISGAREDAACAWPTGVRRILVGSSPRGEVQLPPLTPGGEQLAYVIYTSGSTGEPKGVMIEHRSALNTLFDLIDAYEIGPGDRVLAVSALSFDLSVWDIFGALAAGATVVVPEGRPNPDPAYWATLVAEQGITLWNSVPAIVAMVVDHAERRPEIDLSSLRHVWMSGDWIPLSLPERLRVLAPNARQLSMGGATEASIWSISYPIDAVDPSWRSVPYGRPMRNQRFYVLSDALEPCPVGVKGELHIGGVGVARGYWRDPERSADRFVEHPESGERLYKTGDLGRYDENGVIEFLGRRDSQIKLRGFRIELGEVDATLAQHALVESCVSMVREINGADGLVSYVVPDDEAARAAQHAQIIASWETTFDRVYVESAHASLDFDIAGWTSMFTGEDLPAEEMRQWLAETVALIDGLAPRRVLEVGCGTGMLLWRIAPHCEVYEAADISAAVLDKLAAEVERRQLAQVRLHHCPADDLGEIPTRAFDTVILNSVVHYFPSVAYLCEVVDGLVDRTCDGGHVLVGDIRSLSVHTAVHAAIALRQWAGEPADVDSIRARALEMAGADSQLVVAPEVFMHLAERHPRISGVRIHPKLDGGDNELTAYRYEVIFEVGARPTPREVRWHDCRAAGLTAKTLNAWLGEGGALLALAGVPNPRLGEVRRAAYRLGLESEGSILESDEVVGLSPEQAREIAAAKGYEVEVQWRAQGLGGGLDMVFWPSGGEAPRLQAPKRGRGPLALEDYGNRPYLEARGLVAELRGHLEEYLPAYMVPGAIVPLRALPMTSNGKIDRGRLPKPTVLAEGEAYAPPRDQAEADLAEMWAEVFKRKQVGVDDDFFALGGHSLIAVGLMARIEDHFEVELPLHVIFEAPTIAGLREALRHAPKRRAVQSIESDVAQRYAAFPLTELQQAYWLGEGEGFELGGVTASYWTEFFIDAMELDHLEAAVRRLIARHDGLRVVVDEDGSQRVLAKVPELELPVFEAEDEDAVAAARAQILARPLSMSTWPQMHLGLIRAQAGWHLVVNMALALMDGKAGAVFLRELFLLLKDPEAALPDLELTLRDYVLARRAIQDGDVGAQALAYWRERLPKLPPAPELPLARPPSTLARQAMTRHTGVLDRETWSRLKARAKEHEMTANMTLCTAYAEVLGRFSQSSHFTLNVLYANRVRLHPETDAIVGNLSATLLLEVDADAGATFAERAKSLQEQLWADLAHGVVSGVRVLGELNRARRELGRANMPIVFASTLPDDGGDTNPLPPGWRELGGGLQTPQVWIDHNLAQRDGALVYNWDVCDALFPEGLIDAMMAAYHARLCQLAVQPDAWQSGDFEVRSPAVIDRQRRANATDGARPRGRLDDGFFEHAAAQPEAPAVICGERILSYGELAGRARALAGRIGAAGIEAGQLVAVAMAKGWEQIVGVLGVLAAGGVYVPIDPGLPRARIHHLAQTCELSLAIVEAGGAAIDWPETVSTIAVSADDPCSGPQIEGDGQPQDLAYIIFTSGSTGTPKGVMIEHRAALGTIAEINERFALGPGDRVLALSSLSFDLSVWDVFGTLTAGAAIVIPEPEATRDPGRWASLMDEAGVTVWNSVPALFEMAVTWLAGHGRSPSKLRLALLSGDWIPLTLADAGREIWPELKVISLGGATEASIWSVSYIIDAVEPDWVSVPYGRGLRNQRIYVLDEHLRPCPEQVRGELYLAGDGLARGYWKDPEKTAAAFFSHPRTGERLYRTGDWGRWRRDGQVEFLGRQDSQVKVGGYRIELGEIEAALLEHGEIAQAAVVVSDTAGGQKRLLSFVVPVDDISLSRDEVREFVAARVPSYMVPAEVVLLKEMPLSANGKVDRGQLGRPQAVQTGAPERRPRRGRERELARIWSDLLGVAELGTDDDFFELGGTSLLAVQLTARLRRQLGFELSLPKFFADPTIAALARLLRDNHAADWSPLVTIEPGADETPLYLVHPVGGNVLCYQPLAQLFGSRRPLYGLQCCFDADDEDAMSVEAMAERYVNAIVESGAKGPLCIGGWSMGGVIAWDMAARLSAAGVEVAQVVLIDSIMPDPEEPRMGEERLFLRFLRDLNGGRGPRESGDVEPWSSADLGERFQEAMSRGQLPRTLDVALLTSVYRVFRKNLDALHDYRPQPLETPVIILEAAVEAERRSSPATEAWLALARGSSISGQIPGDHYTLIDAMHREALVKAITDALEQN